MRRLGTAAVLLAIVIGGLFVLPPAGIAALMAIIIGVAALEWARLCGLDGIWQRLYAGAIVAALLAVFSLGLSRPVFVAAAAFWIVAAPLWLWIGLRAEHRLVLGMAGFLILVTPALAVVALAPRDALLVLMVAWIADTAAYYAGRRWGRHKLAPSISPGKTWEGAAGALIAIAAYAMMLSVLFTGIQGARIAAFLAAGALLVMVSIVGDLFESAAKRQAGVKDSGTLLPGHGGMMDRIDSACALLPVAAVVVPHLA